MPPIRACHLPAPSFVVHLSRTVVAPVMAATHHGLHCQKLILYHIMGQQGYTAGDLGWSELTTANAADAISFYTALAGWQLMGEPVPGYHIFGRGSEALGGFATLQPGDTTPRWMPYITVDDLDASLAKAESLGASVCLPPMALPEDSGRIAIIKDPQGVMTGLAQYNKKECA